jgi:hypothetical protein
VRSTLTDSVGQEEFALRAQAGKDARAPSTCPSGDNNALVGSIRLAYYGRLAVANSGQYPLRHQMGSLAPRVWIEAFAYADGADLIAKGQ